MARLGFCGTGQMGAPMAARLVAAGHDVAVWNRTTEKVDPLVKLGARPAKTPADAASEAEGVFTMLATPQALEDVVFGPHGLAEGLADGPFFPTLIEMSTVGPAEVQSVRERLEPRVQIIDAPVLGSVAAAQAGKLEIFVGASDGQFARWAGVLQAMGTPSHVGPPGAGASMKLVANSTLGALMTALGEALALARSLGLDLDGVLDVLADSPIGVTARSKRSRIEHGQYPPNFKLALAVKDMDIVMATAAQRGLEL